eukprot:TRINITY_DN194_c0_g2_i3.p1 TRINITY_DN194_c0_g2~~TRINITY_DN194_c0_g2_i3.p1  ORF type:complete len:142 (+),score=65.13 TRINITY_DN194_c0_g2_i3:54-428(+)
MDVKKATQLMLTVVAQGGIAPGGLNFDAKVRRESVDLHDLFVAHIGAMDTFARGLRIAAAMISDGHISGMLRQRYASWDSGVGAKVEQGQSSFEELEQWVLANGDPTLASARQEEFEVIFSAYL